MKLWLDDERDPLNDFWWKEFPQLAEGGWTWAKTVDEAISIIEGGGVTFISFDNDLQQPKEGRHLANWIEEKAHWQEIPKMGWAIHSKNSVASPSIEIAMSRADEEWNKQASKTNWYRNATLV